MCFRAWSHYRALYGGKYLEHLLATNLVQTRPSETLDAMYTSGILSPSEEQSEPATPTTEKSQHTVEIAETSTTADKASETMLMQSGSGELLAEAFELPEMEIEVDRAIVQIEKSIAKAKEDIKEQQKQPER